VSVGTLTQSTALISAIIAAPSPNAASASNSASDSAGGSRSGSEISAAVAIGGSAFASNVAASALAASTAPFSNVLATDIIRIGSACVAASLALNTTSVNANANGATSGSGSGSNSASSASFSRAQQLAVGAAVSSAAESVARGLLIGALVGQQPAAVGAGSIALAASRRGVDAATGLVQGGLNFSLPSAAANDGSTGTGAASGAGGAGAASASQSAAAGAALASDRSRLIAVQMPPSVLADSIGAAAAAAVVVDATLVTFSSDIYAFANANASGDSVNGKNADGSSTLPSSAPVVSFTLYDGGAARNGAGARALPVRNLKSSSLVLITIPRGPNEENRSQTQCQFWNTVPFVVSGQGFGDGFPLFALFCACFTHEFPTIFGMCVCDVFRPSTRGPPPAARSRAPTPAQSRARART
jgi:hypothetical protein